MSDKSSLCRCDKPMNSPCLVCELMHSEVKKEDLFEFLIFLKKRIERTESDLNHIPSFNYIDHMIKDYADKIKEIENTDKNGHMYLKGQIDRLADGLKGIEGRTKDIEYRLSHIIELPKEIEIRVERILEDLEAHIDRGRQSPHKCPVCDGEGMSLTSPKACQACDDGIVWG